MAEPSGDRTPQRVTEDRIAVVVNGNAKGVTDDLVATLDQIVESGDLYVSRSLDEGREIARTIVASRYPTVLTGGGDGTFVQMVTWITTEADSRGRPWPRFGLLRLGTGNALAWALGAQGAKKGVVADLARLRREAGSRKLRLIEINGMRTPFAGMGIDATALQHFNDTKSVLKRVPVLNRYTTGALSYAVSISTRTLPSYLFRPHPRVRIVNEGATAFFLDEAGRPAAELGPGETLFEGPCRLMSMATTPYWGYGARAFPFAEEREDRFSLRVADLTTFEVVRNFRPLWRGEYRNAETIRDFLVERISAHFAEPMPLQVGGDAGGEHTSVTAALGERPLEVVDFYAPPTLSR